MPRAPPSLFVFPAMTAVLSLLWGKPSAPFPSHVSAFLLRRPHPRWDRSTRAAILHSEQWWLVRSQCYGKIAVLGGLEQPQQRFCCPECLRRTLALFRAAHMTLLRDYYQAWFRPPSRDVLRSPLSVRAPASVSHVTGPMTSLRLCHLRSVLGPAPSRRKMRSISPASCHSLPHILSRSTARAAPKARMLTRIDPSLP